MNYESGNTSDDNEYLIVDPGKSVIDVAFSQFKDSDYDYSDEIENMILNVEAASESQKTQEKQKTETKDTQKSETEKTAIMDSGYSADKLFSVIESGLDELISRDEAVSYERSDNGIWLFITWPGGTKNYASAIRFYLESGDEIQSPDEIPASMSVTTTERFINGESDNYIKGSGAEVTEHILQFLDYDQYGKGEIAETLNATLDEMINEAGTDMKEGGNGTSERQIGTHEISLQLSFRDSERIDETYTIKF